jgi:hypothetical protein
MAGKLTSLLSIGLRAETSHFSKGMSNARKDIHGFQGSVKSLNSTMTTLKRFGAGYLSFQGLRSGFNSIIGSLEKMGDVYDTAQKMNIGAASLKGFGYAAEQVGASAESVNNSIGKMSRTLGDAKGGSDKAIKAFTDLGISEKEISTLNTQQMVYRLSDALKAEGDESIRASKGAKILGRGVQESMGFWMQGSGEIRKYGDELSALNGGLTDADYALADMADDSIKKVGVAWEGLKSQLVIGLTPAILENTNNLIEWSKEGGNLASTAGSIKDALTLTGEAFEIASWPIKKVVDLYKEYSYWVIKTNAAEGVDIVPLDKTKFKTYTPTAEEQRPKLAFGKKAGIDPFGLGSASLAKEIKAPGFDVDPSVKKKLDEEAKKQADAKTKSLTSEAASLFEKTRTPQEAFASEKAKLDELAAAGLIDQETYQRGLNAAKEDMTSELEKQNKAVDKQKDSLADLSKYDDAKLDKEYDTSSQMADQVDYLSAQADLLKKMYGGEGGSTQGSLGISTMSMHNPLGGAGIGGGPTQWNMGGPQWQGQGGKGGSDPQLSILAMILRQIAQNTGRPAMGVSY